MGNDQKNKKSWKERLQSREFRMELMIDFVTMHRNQDGTMTVEIDAAIHQFLEGEIDDEEILKIFSSFDNSSSTAIH